MDILEYDGWDVPDIMYYLTMSDDDLKAATSAARSEKIKGIRKWPKPLSDKQRYCLAAWLEEKDQKYA